ncbi:MAG: alpha/beta hydrolase, partial [Flavisolibacter sp.]|nr:alpha/beta hydrolase [Flavisolibacter sp.]
KPPILFGMVFLVMWSSMYAQKDSTGLLILEPYTFRTYDGKAYDAEFGKLWVKENRNSGLKRLIQLSFVRLKSSAPSPAAPVVFLAGGPGVPGIGMGQVPVYFHLFNQLREVADIILLDQRGSGLSVPSLVCSNDNPSPEVFKNDKNWLTTFEQVTQNCATYWRKQGVDLSAYTTEASADDLDDLRKALKVEKISLIGHSYGTVLAQAAIRRHGDKLEKVVLANTEGSDDLLASADTWDMLIKKLSYLAKSDTSINKLVPDFEAMYRSVLDKLGKSPVVVTVQQYAKKSNVDITIGKIGLQWIVRNYMADARTYARLPAFIYAIYKGDYSILAKEVEPFYNGFSRSVMATAIDCSIGWPTSAKAKAGRKAAGALFSNVNLQWSGKVCDLIGIKRAGDQTRTRIFSTIPTLFISGTLDTNTPPFQAEEIRWGFPNSYHLVVENGGHETLPSQEVQAVILDFFKGIDIQSRTVKFAPPDFISPSELKTYQRQRRM